MIMQGVTVLAVVVAYELAARVSRRQQQRRVGVATGEAAVVTPEIPPELAAKPGDRDRRSRMTAVHRAERRFA